MSERRTTVGPRRTRYSWIGTPGSQPPETEKAQVGDSVKREEKEKEERRMSGFIPPPPIFSSSIPECWEKIACCGRSCLGVGGDSLYVMEGTGIWSPG